MEAQPINQNLERVPRCISCGYVLLGLESNRCPECGRPFDLNDPKTVSLKPPFVGWWYWTPGVLLAAFIACAGGAISIALWGYGAAVCIVLPVCIGTLLGYGLRQGPVAKFFLALLVATALAVGLFSMSLAGVFCATCFFIVLLVPTYVGVFFGSLLRHYLKSTQWDQRWHLPAMVLILVPLLAAGIERVAFPPPYAIEEVRTAVDVPVGARRAFNGVMFYEQVNLPAPWLLRYALPKPLYTIGSSWKVGDRKICVYTKGRLVKYITAVQAGRRLDFAVIEQTHIENRSVRLIGGSFIFTPIDADHTRITLSTRYEPLLSPRWAWRPFETLGMGTLHRFVLEGMAEKAEDRPADATESAQ
ncbi:MAG TPA: hypothetical protein VHY37_04595 [Tepidisphaeraceae bacterium]|nr:hypothetical protein [Tepidisphaeraceae bacterium]